MQLYAHITVLLCLIAAPHALAQQDSCLRRTVPVSITTEAGYPIQDLTGITLTGKFRGKPVKILSVAPSTHPPRIVVMLDVSSSVLGAWPFVRRTARALIESAPPEVRFALVIFMTSGDVLARFESDPAAVIAKLDALPEREGFRKGTPTALWDSILLGLDLLGEPQAGDAIYVITDGLDIGSQKSWRDVERALVDTRVRLFASVLAEGPRTRGATPEELGGVTDMTELANVSGGSVSIIGRREVQWLQVEGVNIRVFGQRLYKQIAEVYLADVELPEPVDQPSSWKIELKKEKDAKTRGLELHYPRKLMPCAGPSPATPK